MVSASRTPNLAVYLASLASLVAVCRAAEPAAQNSSYLGQPLSHWVAQANAAGGGSNVEQAVAALTAAVLAEDPNGKRDAADALAALGPKAIAALPALLNQFGHEFPWVRVSCQAAVSAMGADAVPALIQTVETKPGSPRILAAYVLAGLGEAAKPAVPVIEKVMATETPLAKDRLTGVLKQIDPAKFGAEEPVKRADYEPAPVQASVEPAAGDWSQFHGPGRDAICREDGLLSQWPEAGPELLWTLKGLGRGYSTVAIVKGKLYTMGDRPVASGAEETQCVMAFDLASRKELWAASVGAPHRDGGPRSTPTVDGDAVYAIGTDGDLVCLDAATGALRWRKSFVADFQGKFMGVWKFSESVLIDGERLICTPGGPDAIMVALNKRTGEVIWKCAMPDIGTQGSDGAGYCSAVAAEICGVRQYVQMVGRGLIGVEAASGRFLWGYNRIANNVANVTTPVVRGDYVFGTTAYNVGAVLLKISREGEAFKAAEVYFVNPKDFQNHHGGVVLVGDCIYGGHGANKGDPACLEFGTGKVMWKERAPAKGSAGVLFAGGHLIYRYDRGDVYLIEASPDAMKVKGHFKTPDADGPAWAHPVIHQGRLYLRHDGQLLCYDVRGK